MRRISLIAALVTALACPALAAEDPCDTLVLPPGVGISGPMDVTAINALVAANFADGQVFSILYQGLINVDPQDRIDLPHSVAQSVEVLDDGARFRVTLRPWPWSDGKPVTADDVLFTWEIIQKLKENYVNFGSGGIPQLIKSVDVLNPQQFDVVLTRAVNPTWFEMNGLSQLTPLPRHAWGNPSADDIWENQSNVAYFKVVDGPFQIENFSLGRSISFTRNPLYPLEKAPFNRLVEKFVNSNGGELQGVESGELDMANLPHEAYGTNVGDNHLTPTPPSYGVGEIGLNFKSTAAPFFRDILVRQAMESSIDQRQMIDKLWHGQGVENYGPVPTVPDTFLSPALRSGQLGFHFNLDRARALLDQAGYKPGPDGVRVKNGVRLAFTVMVPAGTATSLMMAQMMQPDLRAAGIEMKIRQLDYSQMMSALYRHSGDWQAYMLISGEASYPSGETFYNTGGAFNFGGYSDPKMDRIIDASNFGPGMDGLYQFQDYASQQLPEIYIPVSADDVLSRPWISGITRIIAPGSSFYPQLLTFNQEACHAAHVNHAR